jgi:hypothetical protein
METAIGVFPSRDGAEAAVKDLWAHGVPEQAVVFLTRAESEAKAGRGGAAASGGFAATLMSVPGIGQVFALGLGAAALLGLSAGPATVFAEPASRTPEPQPTPDQQCADDAAFFRDVLQQGRSLVVVRTDSAEIARTASRRLDCLGLGRDRSPRQRYRPPLTCWQRGGYRYQRKNHARRRQSQAARDGA